jgi:hypothetical protein
MPMPRVDVGIIPAAPIAPRRTSMPALGTAPKSGG